MSRNWRWGQRNPIVAGLTLALLLSLVISLVGRWLKGVRHLEERSLQRPKALWDAALADSAMRAGPD